MTPRRGGGERATANCGADSSIRNFTRSSTCETFERFKSRWRTERDEIVRVCPECGTTVPATLPQCRCGYQFPTQRVLTRNGWSTSSAALTNKCPSCGMGWSMRVPECPRRQELPAWLRDRPWHHGHPVSGTLNLRRGTPRPFSPSYCLSGDDSRDRPGTYCPQ
jgi:hypothetical protein